MTLAFALMATTALAGSCPKPNEYAASAFKTIETGGDIASYLERYIVGRTAKNEDCEDMYQVAIRHRNEKARKHLDRIGFGPQSEKDMKENKYFEYAVRFGDTGVIEEMRGKLPEDYLRYYATPYIGQWAGSGNTIEVIDWFIANQKLTADNFFISAINSNSKYVVEQLIRRGADVRNYKVLEAALHRVYWKPAELPVLELLIRAGASITPHILNFAAYDNAPAELEMLRLAGGHYTQKSLDLATSRGNVEAMKYFIGLGLQLEDVTPGALHLATKSGKIEAIKFVLQTGVDIDGLSSEGRPALSYTTSPKVLDYLASKGANLDQMNTSGRTAFHTAIASFNLEAVEWFLKKGISPRQMTREGVPAVQVGFTSLSSETEKYFAIIDLLIKAGADINQRDQEGYSLLMRTAMTTAPARREAIKFLLNRGADKNLKLRQGRKKLRALDLFKASYEPYGHSQEIRKLLE